jgi:hypothetical protein
VLAAAPVLLAACAQPVRPVAPVALNGAGSPAWLDEVAARCARIASCAHPHDAPRLRDPSACVAWWVGRARDDANDPIHTCVDAARTCGDVNACVHGGADARAAAFCSARSGVMSACEANQLMSCAADAPAESQRVDCGALGARCEEHQTGGLVVRGCFSSRLCPPNAPEERCDGDAIVTCHDGAVGRVACARGTRCEEHVEPNGERSAMCEPLHEHAHCTEVGGRWCRGDVLIECTVHGHFGDVRVSDCAGAGLRCASAGEGARAACVVKRPVECEPGPARCDGDDGLAFCAAGRMLKVSCRGLGLGPCDPDAQGPAAACGVPTKVR